MLEEALTALAAAGGTAVVQAAGTDAWTGLRTRAARLLGRGDRQREQAELDRLDQTAAALEAVGSAEAEGVRIRQQEIWQARFVILLESLNDDERAQAAAELRDVLHGPDSAASAETGGLAVGGNMDIRADGGSVAAVIIRGNVNVGNPSQPDRS
ncbi:hypothetical protein [Streptomyces sp. bgisy095]|uniref:hypothetical protein n=1 Tax=unclassified Streptomyces TaxID=2593676 RepID=UPI003D7579F9